MENVALKQESFMGPMRVATTKYCFDYFQEAFWAPSSDLSRGSRFVQMWVASICVEW